MRKCNIYGIKNKVKYVFTYFVQQNLYKIMNNL